MFVATPVFLLLLKNKKMRGSRKKGSKAISSDLSHLCSPWILRRTTTKEKRYSLFLGYQVLGQEEDYRLKRSTKEETYGLSRMYPFSRQYKAWYVLSSKGLLFSRRETPLWELTLVSRTTLFSTGCHERGIHSRFQVPSSRCDNQDNGSSCDTNNRDPRREELSIHTPVKGRKRYLDNQSVSWPNCILLFPLLQGKLSFPLFRKFVVVRHVTDYADYPEHRRLSLLSSFFLFSFLRLLMSRPPPVYE